MINVHGFNIDTDMKCEKCNKAILSREKFLNELQKNGLEFNRQTNSITVSGSFGGYYDLSTLQKLAQELEQLTALKCNSCGNIYCLTCLFNYAPMHPTSGGKACFSCKGSISYAQESDKKAHQPFVMQRKNFSEVKKSKDDEILEAVINGDRILAMKLYRELHGGNLAEAKAFIEGLL